MRKDPGLFRTTWRAIWKEPETWGWWLVFGTFCLLVVVANGGHSGALFPMEFCYGLVVLTWILQAHGDVRDYRKRKDQRRKCPHCGMKGKLIRDYAACQHCGRDRRTPADA